MQIKKKEKVETQIKDQDLILRKHLKIATGAAKLFIKKGYFKSSIRDVSKATGLTIGNLYDYIRKKEDILYLVFNVFHSTWTNHLKEVGVFEIKDPIEQLKTAIEKMLDLVNNYKDMVFLMYTECKVLPKGFLKAILEKESGLVKCFEEILRRGMDKGVFRIKDPFFYANIIVYLLSLEPLRGWNLKSRYRKKNITNLIQELFLTAILKPNKQKK